ncbi:uncharacterized protein PRCAT00006029001 [Priceomyces carsonii]|uniref:uncharacterized protein n=1 Tax=Priceomyces carsonii TaxID=28549 RepID=UPI002EDB4AA2|nr:unnamed protein product [Priceomyces carsonii]
MLFRSAVRKYSSQSVNPLISSTLLLSRNPIVTADLPEFENQYYKYQNELWKRLMWTFPKWFYYREGTLSEQRYRELNKNPVFNNPNVEFPKGRPEIRHQRDRRFKQEINLPKTYSEAKEEETDEFKVNDSLSRKIVPNSRLTKADENKDLTSLERKLTRTLYLVVGDSKRWTLPNFKEETANDLKPLHKLAEEGLYKIGGENINYFNVSNTPCHLYKGNDGKREYFIKSHILSGRFSPSNSALKYMWLTKEEMAKNLEKDYYNDIKHLLSDV